QCGAQMSVTRADTITVVDLDRVAVGASSACVDDNPRRCCSHRRSPRPRQIYTGMECELFRERIAPYTEATGAPVIDIDGPHPWHSVHSRQSIQRISSIGQLRKIFAVTIIGERRGQREQRTTSPGLLLGGIGARDKHLGRKTGVLKRLMKSFGVRLEILTKL